MRRRPISQYASEPVRLVLATHQRTLGPRIEALSRRRRSRHMKGVTTTHPSSRALTHFIRELTRTTLVSSAFISFEVTRSLRRRGYLTC